MDSIRSAWEADRAGLVAVYADDSVLDQMLLGCAQVYWEIQALQDYGIAVVRAASLLPASSLDHAVLRAAVQTACDLTTERRALSVTGSRPAAFWSVTATDQQLITTVSEAEMYAYRPDVVYKSLYGLTGGQALQLAKQIGAIDAQASPSIEPDAPLATATATTKPIGYS